ncbi:DUF2066 domain-containing protein [Photobacterium angustum]|uniref:DUF2066 domain-containing protein n=1 Tax=Photobacterium angustum TaxID=661 RepID=A0A2S7W009_PHOAN|nr:DUF2066 domain-containing protein [Photobacterium angustum]PQJ67697.1 hypothetical protein BTO08_09930 [Photobacterium angustum]
MLRFALLFLALLALPIKAATVSDLYQAQVVMPADGQNPDQAAREQGFKQVLVKVTGNPNIAQNSVVAQAIANSSSYVSQFGYGQDNGQKTLDLTFDQVQIKQLLTQAKANFWSAQRPNILVWMVDDNGNSRDILWDQSTNALVADTKQAANDRGLPVTFPVGDFNDVTAVHVSDLWGSFIDPITSASQRYNVGGLLLVKAHQQGADKVELTWQLYAQQPSTIAADTQPITGKASGTLVQASLDMMNQVTNQLAQKYAIELGGVASGSVNIEVENVNSTEDFFTLERMLNQMTTVNSANAVNIKGDKVIFRMNLSASDTEFKRELSHESRISADDSTVTNTNVTTMPNTDVSQDPNTLDVTATQSQPQTQPENYVAPDDMYIWHN